MHFLTLLIHIKIITEVVTRFIIYHTTCISLLVMNPQSLLCWQTLDLGASWHLHALPLRGSSSPMRSSLSRRPRMDWVPAVLPAYHPFSAWVRGRACRCSMRQQNLAVSSDLECRPMLIFNTRGGYEENKIAIYSQ